MDELRNLKADTADTTSNQIQTMQENSSNTTTNKLTDMMKMIEEKLSSGLSSGLSKIETNMNQLIETKLNKLPISTNNAIMTDMPTSYASAAASKNHVSGNLRSIMMNTKNEELMEQSEKKKRAKNIMVFGRSENTGRQRWQQDDDKAFAEQLFKDVQAGSIKANEVCRIGIYNSDDTKVRPLKITLETEEEKEKIMNNLKNLKGNQEYKGISIKEDYTISERQLIKEYLEQAKALNALEKANKSTTIYRVRGTPKNGLVLKRFTTLMETTDSTNL